jgi:tetratricopeptide (TPR) repeat protein
MRSQKLSQFVFTIAFATVSLTACGQAQDMKSSVSAPAAQEQAVWEKLTAEAEVAKQAGDKKLAESKYKEAIEAARALAVDSPAQAAATANLASFYYVQGDGAQANQLYSQSLAMHEKSLGMMHVDLVVDLIGLARVYNSEKKYKESQASYERAIEILTKAGKPVPAEVQSELDAVKKAQS